MKLSSKARLSFLVLIILIGSVVVYATTIGPTGVYDTPWGNFTTGVTTPRLILDGSSRSTWPTGGTEYGDITLYKAGATGTYTVAQDSNGDTISNQTDAYTVITAAFSSINSDGGGKLKVLPGIYTIDGNTHATLNIPSGEEYVIEGVALTNSLQSPLTNGGSVFSFTNGARFEGSVTGIGLVLRDMTFSFSGTYTDSAFDFTADAWVSSYGCGYAFSGTVPNGNAGNPSSTLAGNVMNIGKVSGPTALAFTWKDNRFYDNRQGSATSSCLINFGVENLVFENNFFRLNPANTLTDGVGGDANLIFCNPVDIAIFRSNTFFTENGWTGAYANQFMSSGNDKNFYFEGQQFLNSTRVAANFYTNSGQMKVEGVWSVEGEGGQGPGSSDAIDLSVGGGGTVYVSFSGEGWEKWGSATISNGVNTTGNIAHGLLGTPTYVSFTGTTSDSSEVYASTVDGTNLVGTVDGNVGGDRIIYYYARYSIVG